jgi:hypothetical protein
MLYTGSLSGAANNYNAKLKEDIRSPKLGTSIHLAARVNTQIFLQYMYQSSIMHKFSSVDNEIDLFKYDSEIHALNFVEYFKFLNKTSLFLALGPIKVNERLYINQNFYKKNSWRYNFSTGFDYDLSHKFSLELQYTYANAKTNIYNKYYSMNIGLIYKFNDAKNSKGLRV